MRNLGWQLVSPSPTAQLSPQVEIAPLLFGVQNRGCSNLNRRGCEIAAGLCDFGLFHFVYVLYSFYALNFMLMNYYELLLFVVHKGLLYRGYLLSI